MVRNVDRLQFTPIRQAPTPARSARTAASFQSMLREQSSPPANKQSGNVLALPKAPTAAPVVNTRASIAAASTTVLPAAPAAKTPTANAAIVPAGQSAVPSLHTVAALPNGGRMVDPTGNNALTGGTIAYNPNYYATAEAAYQLAAQLGGSVVDLSGHISNNQPEYFIDLPNGTRINAGNLLGVLNNAVFKENSRVMDGQIAELLNNNAVGTPGAGVGLYTVVNGQVTFDPNGRPTVYPVYTT